MPKHKALPIVLWLGLFLLSAFFLHWRLKSAYSATYSYFRWSDFGPLPDWAGLALALRWPMRGAAALGALLLALVEWRAGLVSGGLRRTLAGRRGALLALTLVGAASGSYYLLPGQPAFSSDAQAYIGYAALARLSLAEGAWPFWTNFGGMGMPFLQYYGPLYTVAVALASFLIPDLFEATKAVQFALHAASFLGMYAYVARLTGSRSAGFAAAWAYGFTFYRYHAILFTGILHLGAHLALLPWQFYCAERMLAGPRRARAWAGFALLGGAAILAHPNYGVWINILALLYALLRCWTAPAAVLPEAPAADSAPRRSATGGHGPLPPNGNTAAASSSSGVRLRLSAAVGAGTAVSLLLGAYPVAGSFLERDLVATQWFQGARSFLVGPIRWEQAFTFLGSYWTSEWFGGYVGLSIVLLALAGAGWAARHRDGRGAALGLPLLLTLYLALGPAYLPFDRIFQGLPLGWLVYIYSTPGRYLAYVSFFAAAGVGLFTLCLARAGFVRRAWEGLLERGSVSAGTSLPHLLALLVVAVVSADVIPPGMQANSLRPSNYAADFKAAYAWLGANASDRAARALDPAASLNAGDIQQFALLPSFGSVAHEIPARSYLTIGYLQQAVLEDLRGGELGRLSRDWLYLTDTAYIVTDLPVPPEAADWTQFASGPVSVLALPEHSPVLVSERVVLTDGDQPAREVLREMNLDWRNSRAGFLAVAEMPDWPAPPAGPDLTVQVLAHEVGPARARLIYELSAPAYVQLSYSHYPYLRVLLDGVETPTVPGRFGQIVLRSEAGVHTAELVPYLSAWRIALVVAGLLAAAGCILLALRR